MTIQEGFGILIDTIKNKKTHKFYKRVNHLAELYNILITGENMETLLHRFVRREDEELFQQRKKITQAITPAVNASLMNPFYKVGRSNIIKKIDFDSTQDSEAKIKSLENSIKNYNGDKSLDSYMELRYVDLNFTDPNAFIITEFDNVELGPNGEMTDKVKPRPFECSSKEAINYFYENNVLKWLIVKQNINYVSAKGTNKEKECDGHSYTIYLDNDGIKLTQIDNDFASVVVGNKSDVSYSTPKGIVSQTLYRASDNELFIYEEFNHKAGKVPAKIVGYKLDLVTKGKTYVSPMHDALPYFMKSIKTVSEFDLTMSLHAFAQKFQYVNRCTAEGCDGGNVVEGTMCKVCKGSGWAIHSSTQDAVIIRLPKTKDEMFPLEQMVHYERPPIDILEFQDKYIKELKNEARQAVFNSEIFNKSQVASAETATEVKISLESVYDTLRPFSIAYGEMYVYQASLIATFTDIKDAIVIYKFPKDFKFKTLSDLLFEQKMANEANTPGYVKNEISMEIAEQIFIDKPEELKKIKSKQMFFPFPDKSPTDIVFIISNGLTTEYNKVLWANFDSIFQALESDAEEQNKYFYDYTHELQQELLEGKVEEFITDIVGSQPEQATDFRTAANQDSSQSGQTEMAA